MKRKNKSTLLVCINCMIITLAILLLPLAFFETSIYVKRSANTFVGDEKYVEVRAEVEAVAAQHEGAVIEESVTERVNSKGVTTSMVTFTVKETVRRNGLDFLLHGVGHSEGMSGVGPANVMRLLLGSMAVSLVLLLCASYKTLELPRTDLPKTANRLYTAADVFALIAWFCVPAFVRAINYTFARQVDLLVGGHIQNDALLAQYTTSAASLSNAYSAQVDVIVGNYNPTGKLSVTLPSCEAVIALTEVRDADGNLLYEECASPNDVPGYDKDQYIAPEVLAQSPSGSYIYKDADGNSYVSGFGLSY